MNIIIVDDEPMIRAGFEKLIGRMGMNIEVIGSYSNGFDALAHLDRLEDDELDLLITDIKMPMMDGLKLIEATQNRQFAKMVFSGFSEFEYARKALRFGACDYLLKPIDKQQLYDVLQRIKAQRTSQHLEQEDQFYKQKYEKGDSFKGHYVVSNVITQLQEQYDHNFDLDETASHNNISAHYLSRLFKQETGKTITDFLIEIRIDKAKQFLADYPQMKNYEVAQSVGYSDPVYFQKLFKRITGFTPREFKEMN